MRGRKQEQSSFFSLKSPEDRVPKSHPLRRVKGLADAELEKLSPVFEAMYSKMGRPSIPPERLLKACLLIALYSIPTFDWVTNLVGMGGIAIGVIPLLLNRKKIWVASRA